ncbi:MAG: hypothetical protein EOO77_02625 [Oxalobacteraceae bacterium]|nr:MAG: hypothetical protein EOO77_02625 [Oxalobacteraceae bacterium]
MATLGNQPLPELDYHPTYQQLTPQAGGYYLRWLASGAKNQLLG